MKQFKTERAVQQQKLICGSLVELMHERSYGQITVSDICVQAGIPRRTFYYYYEGKEEVLRDLMFQLMRESELESMFPTQGDTVSVEAAFARFFRYWGDCHRRELDAIVRNDLGQLLVNLCMQWVPMDRRWARLNANMPQERRIIGSFLGITCVFYTLYYWQRNGYTHTPEELARNVTDLLTKPIFYGE